MRLETQHPMFPPSSEWTPPRVSDLPSWAEARRVSVDTETRDPQLRSMGCGARRPDCYIVGVSFAIEDGPSHYLPIRHAGGGNLDEGQVLGYLKEQAKVFKGDLCGANLPYDIDHMAEDGIEFEPKMHRDVQVADPLINELHNKYSLNAIAARWDFEGKDDTLLYEAAEAHGLSAKSDLWRLHSKYVGGYATRDSILPLQILRRQEREIEAQELWEIYNLESQLLPVLVRMRRRGVAIDFDRLEHVEGWSIDEETKALAEIKRLTGINISVGDVWRPEPLARALKHIGVEVELTPKTKKPSVTTDVLEAIDHPVAGLIRRARKVNRLRTTFAESVRRYEINGRIHATFNQLRRTRDEGADDERGARFGRMSCVDPNLQQQPGKKDPELGLLWRSIYIPDDGGTWACLDFSQQEPRWAVHLAELSGLPKAYEAGEKYRNDPLVDNHQMMADMAGIERTPAKIILLGLLYGMGEAKLCHKLGLSTVWRMDDRTGKMKEYAGVEGASLLARFHGELPFVRRLAWKARDVAEERGYIMTILGRRCRFPLSSSPNHEYDWTSKALNRVIQGSSADQTKKAMIIGYAEGFPIQLQVHDELDLSVTQASEAVRLATIMRECVTCKVPMKVDIEFGPNWGNLKAA